MKRALWCVALIVMIIVTWSSWSALRLWSSFNDIERIEVDVGAARIAIAALPRTHRPSPPPVEVDPSEDDAAPLVETHASRDVLDSTRDIAQGPPLYFFSRLLREIEARRHPQRASDVEPPSLSALSAEQLPYHPEFGRSPMISDETFEAFLIIGSDVHGGGGGTHADVIILALIPSDGSAPLLVSIPRDLWLSVPCWERSNRINVTLRGCGDAANGPELLAIAVADFTGIEPDHFVMFDFEGFKTVIDAFGGVEICTDTPLRDVGIFELPAGCTQADGAAALGWVRSRKTREFIDGAWVPISGVNDMTRNERQREVLLQLLGSVRRLDSLSSLIDIAERLSDAVTIDDDLSFSKAVKLAWSLRDTPPEEITQITILVERFTTEEGAKVLLPAKPFSEIFAEHWPR